MDVVLFIVSVFSIFPFLHFFMERNILWLQNIRNSKLTNSSLVGHLSVDKLDVDKAPGAVEAWFCGGWVVFFRSVLFERAFSSSCLISRKDALPQSLFFKLDDNLFESPL